MTLSMIDFLKNMNGLTQIKGDSVPQYRNYVYGESIPIPANDFRDALFDGRALSRLNERPASVIRICACQSVSTRSAKPLASKQASVGSLVGLCDPRKRQAP